MDWIIEKHKYPQEIVDFLQITFDIYEIRGRVGESNSIKFIVHTNEGNHAVPHVHAEYGEYQVSIAIETQEILIGNLPKKKLAIAQDWVKQHREKLFSQWQTIAISATSSMTKSALENNLVI